MKREVGKLAVDYKSYLAPQIFINAEEKETSERSS